MVRLTTADRIKIVKTYYENGKSAAATFRALSGDFVRFNRPTQQAIGKIVKKFEETGSVADIARPVHNRNARTTANIAAVKASLANNPNLSIPHIAQSLGLSYGSVWRIMHFDLEQDEPKSIGNESSVMESESNEPLMRILHSELHRYPYKIELTHELKPGDHKLRRNFCDWVLEQQGLCADFANKIFFSDEAYFSLDGYVNTFNCRIWGSETPKPCQERPIQTEKVTVWCALWSGGIIGPYFFENEQMITDNISSELYGSMIKNYFLPEIEEMGLAEMWFQQNGRNTTQGVLSQLQKKFPRRVISKFGDANWPSRSSDLMPLDFFLWSYAKDRVYTDKPLTVEQLKSNIRAVMAEILPEICQKVIENFLKRIEYCKNSLGGHLNDIILHMQ